MRKPMLLALAASLLASGPAVAKRQPDTGTPAQVQRLLACRTITASDQRLACYDRETAAMNQAINTKDLVMVDKEKARAAGRSLFGFSIPNFAGLFGGTGEISQIDGTIKGTSRNNDGGWVIILDDGSVWNSDRRLARAGRKDRQEGDRETRGARQLLAIDSRPEWNQGQADWLAGQRATSRSTRNGSRTLSTFPVKNSPRRSCRGRVIAS